MSPTQLTVRIKQAYSIQDLFYIYSNSCAEFNYIHLSATWIQLSRLTQGREALPPKEELQRLIQHSESVVSHNKLNGRTIANISYAVTKVTGTVQRSTAPLLSALARATMTQIGDFSPAGLANTAWAFAKAGFPKPHLDDTLPSYHHLFDLHELRTTACTVSTAVGPPPSLFDTIARACVARISQFSPQNLANTAWAFAKVGHPSPSLFRAIACTSAEYIHNFKPQELSITAWAYATADHKAPALFDALIRASLARMDEFDSQSLSITAWAFATAGHASPALFDALADASASHIDHFSPQNLANTAWAFATTGHHSPGLFDALTLATATQLDRFNPQELATMACAFVKVGHHAPPLFDALAFASILRIQQFNPQSLASMAWAFATVSHPSPSLFDALARASTSRLDQFSTLGLANLAWALASAGHATTSLFDALARAAATRIGEFDSRGLSTLAWAFATTGHRSPSLFDAVAAASAANVELFAMRGLVNLAWAFAVVGRPLPDNVCQRTVDSFLTADEVETPALVQLHQWQLFNIEQDHPIRLPAELADRCLDAFTSCATTPSRMQQQVQAAVEALGLPARADVVTDLGYSIDIVVEIRGKSVAIEVDGPSHFVERAPSGPTMLKRRQLTALGGWAIYSVPYWEWTEVASSVRGRTRYLQRLLGLVE